MTMGEMLVSKATATAAASSYLQLGLLVRIAIPSLHRIDRDTLPRRVSEEEVVTCAARDPAWEGVGPDITANVHALIRDVDDYLIGLLAEILRGSPDAEVGALLLELWRTRDEEFDPDASGSEVDFNAADVMPTGADTPHNYLLDLMMDAIIVRLMKRHGPELLLAWTDAVENARR